MIRLTTTTTASHWPRQRRTTRQGLELEKAATLDPPGAGKYFYNLGAVLVNTAQTDAAGEAFKKAIESDPNYAPAQYQYGMIPCFQGDNYGGR